MVHENFPTVGKRGFEPPQMIVAQAVRTRDPDPYMTVDYCSPDKLTTLLEYDRTSLSLRYLARTTSFRDQLHDFSN
mgnify:CR=1 FL=1